MANDNQPDLPIDPDSELDVPIKSVAIERILQEIAADRVNPDYLPTSYNRTYSRHNRS